MPQKPQILTNPLTNRGTAFTHEERAQLGLVGRLPAAVETLDQQAARAYKQISEYETDLEKYIYLDQLHNRNEVLYYRVITMGLQLLFEGSDESQGVEGLHVLDGQILRIPDKEGLKIPHIGWNSLDLQNNGRLFKGLSEHPYVYFVHSYYLKAADEAIVTATTEYSTHIHASVEKNNVFACQFHPEKSSTVGLSILKNFAGIGEA